LTNSYSDQNFNFRQSGGYQQFGATGQNPQYGMTGTAGQMPTYGAQLPYSYPTGTTAPTGTAFPAGGPIPTMPATGFVGGAQAPSLGPQVPGMLPLEQSYIENILRLNKGKLATVYLNFDNNTEGLTTTFRGVIEAAGRDHLILSDPQTGMRYLIPMVYFAYATFEEELEYDYPFAAGVPGLSAYAPR